MAQTTFIGTSAPKDVSPEQQAASECAAQELKAKGTSPVAEDTAGAAQGASSDAKKTRRTRGTTFERYFSTTKKHPFDELVWERRQSVITNPDGSVVFKMDGAEIPKAW